MRFTVILADDEPPLLQEQFMIQLVKGSLTPEQVQRQQKNLSISLDANHFCVVSMKTTAENDDYLSQFSVTESVNEMLEQVCSFRTFRYLDKILYLLLLSVLSEMLRIQKALHEASHISKHYNQVVFSCGIGGICDKLENLPLSFSQAMEALEYSLVSAEEAVTAYQDVELYENPVYFSISTEELELAIKLEDQKKVQQEVEKLTAQLEESHYPFNAYQSAVLEIIFSLSGIFRQYHMLDNTIFADAKRMTIKVLSLETGDQLNAWLLNYCNYIIYAIHQRKVDRNSLLAQKAMEYVQHRSYQPISAAFQEDCVQIQNAAGLDHSFVVSADTPIQAAAYSTESGILLICKTTQPAIHVYTANFVAVPTELGKDNCAYGKRSAFCLETQNFPDAINHSNFPSPVLRANTPYQQETQFHFSLRGEA